VALLEFLAHFTYLAFQAYFVGVVLALEWGLHYRRLWQRRWRIVATVGLVTLYGCALDAWAVNRGWGWFDPRLISNIWFGPLLLEELTFWIGTALATVSAVFIFASLEEAGAPWWRLPVDFLFQSDALQALIKQVGPSGTETSRDG
jgi:lycopene cyclase domain-containing protein